MAFSSSNQVYVVNRENGEKTGVENRSYRQDEFPANEVLGNSVQVENIKKLEVRRVDLTEHEIKTEKRNVWKSLIWLCLSLTLAFASSMTLVNSITSLLEEQNLGISTLAVGGASQVIAAALLVPVASKIWGPRRMLQVSLGMNIIFVLAFFYPRWATMITGGFVFGIVQSLLVSTSFMYANTVGYWYEHLIKSNNIDAVLVRVSGLVNCALGGGFLWGNLALYFILDTRSSTSSRENKNSCGAQYCNQELESDVLQPSPERYYALVSLLAALGIVGFGLLFLTEDFSVRLGHTKCSKAEAWSTLKKTWLLLKNPRGFLLVPITTLVGMEESFILGDVTKAFVSCSLSISMVGLVMLSFGITEIPVSIGNWPLVRKFGRCCIVGIAVCILLVIMITMLVWKPNPDYLAMYFILVCLWATSDSLLMSIVFATYAALFENNLEGAFSVGIFWWASGFLFWFGWSQFVCVYVKLYFLIAWIVISYVLYVVLEKIVLKPRSEVMVT